MTKEPKIMELDAIITELVWLSQNVNIWVYKSTLCIITELLVRYKMQIITLITTIESKNNGMDVNNNINKLKSETLLRRIITI